jgi:hypothetical protein
MANFVGLAIVALLFDCVFYESRLHGLPHLEAAVKVLGIIPLPASQTPKMVQT